ncbi:MAG: GNAT family N-acetyltransferase [Oscillospiraceae bacterium]|nr:GNAT family N-acetyltransferase [Oscillospiraceae bacterium]
MTNTQILHIAMEQSSIDLGCRTEDFLKEENTVVYSTASAQARRYLKLPFACNLVSYGSNIVASVSPALKETVRAYIDKYTFYHCFETPNLHALDDALLPFGLRSCFMAEYWLPDADRLAPLPCPYETRLLTPEDFAELYLPQWSNALSTARPQLDVLGIGAYDDGELIGLAGCSADCDTMWQIGIDVLPAYRRQGVASALTAALALECLRLGKVPFYCSAWSNLRSARNALRSGFRPAWVELTARPAQVVDGMNL